MLKERQPQGVSCLKAYRQDPLPAMGLPRISLKQQEVVGRNLEPL